MARLEWTSLSKFCITMTPQVCVFRYGILEVRHSSLTKGVKHKTTFPPSLSFLSHALHLLLHPHLILCTSRSRQEWYNDPGKWRVNTHIQHIHTHAHTTHSYTYTHSHTYTTHTYTYTHAHTCTYTYAQTFTTHTHIFMVRSDDSK